MPEKRLPVGDIALSLENSGLTPEQQLELGLAVDQKSTLIVSRDADAFSLASAVDLGQITHLFVRNASGSLEGVLDIEWTKNQGRVHLNRPDITSFHELTEALFQNKAQYSRSFGHEWLNTVSYGRPPLVVCHQKGHNLHLAPQDPCGQP